MHVLFWSDTLWPVVGGVEVLAANFLRGMQPRGYEFALITRQDDLSQPEREDFAGMPMHRLPFRQALQAGDVRQLVSVRKRLQELKQALRPDLVHIFHSGPGVFFHLQTPQDPPAALVVSLHQLYGEEALAADTIRGRLLRQADWIVACSASVLAETRAQLPEIVARSSVIPNSLPMPALAPASLPLGAPHLLCLGRAVAQKGFDVALRAFARLAGRYPQARLVVAGDGEALPVLVQLAEALQIADRVDFMGWVAPPDVPALINRCAVVVMPSRYEPFGLVALQAGQLARPVVASRVDGLSEVVVDRETGLLVEPEDSEALAGAIARLLDHPELAERMGQAGRRRSREAFAWDRHLDSYDALFQRLVKDRHGGATAH